MLYDKFLVKIYVLCIYLIILYVIKMPTTPFLHPKLANFTVYTEPFTVDVCVSHARRYQKSKTGVMHAQSLVFNEKVRHQSRVFGITHNYHCWLPTVRWNNHGYNYKILESYKSLKPHLSRKDYIRPSIKVIKVGAALFHFDLLMLLNQLALDYPNMLVNGWRNHSKSNHKLYLSKQLTAHGIMLSKRQLNALLDTVVPKSYILRKVANYFFIS